MGYRARGYGIGRGSRRGYGYGRGYGRGYGDGTGYAAYPGDPTKCVKFPWLQRWWWTNPNTDAAAPFVPPTPTSDQEKQFLADQVKYMEQELSALKKRLEEVSSKPETS